MAARNSLASPQTLPVIFRMGRIRMIGLESMEKLYRKLKILPPK